MCRISVNRGSFLGISCASEADGASASGRASASRRASAGGISGGSFFIMGSIFALVRLFFQFLGLVLAEPVAKKPDRVLVRLVNLSLAVIFKRSPFVVHQNFEFAGIGVLPCLQ